MLSTNSFMSAQGGINTPPSNKQAAILVGQQVLPEFSYDGATLSAAL